MLRRALLCGAAICAVLAVSPTTAHAGDICVEIEVTGVVNQTVDPDCVPYNFGVLCRTSNTGFAPHVNVRSTTCVPTPGPQR